MSSLSILSANKSNQIQEQMYGVPVKFADDLFSTLVKDRINQIITSSQIKSTDENSIRLLIVQITDIVKGIVYRHVRENYKVIIQVLTYPKENQDKLLIRSQCLWNYRTDDVLSIEIENEILKFLIVIHGVLA